MAFVELTARRTRRSKTWQDTINPAKFALDASIGSKHYLSGADWLDIDTNWEADTGAWQYKAVKNNFQLHARNVLNAGDTVQWLDPASGETVTLQPLALNWVDNVTDSRQQIAIPGAVTATVNDNKLYWPDGYGMGRHFQYTASSDQLIKELIIDSAANLPAPTVANPYLEVEFILKKSAGVSEYVDGVLWDRTTKVTTANAIEYRQTSNGPTIWAFSAPIAYDANRRWTPGILTLRRQGATRYITVRFDKTWIDNATFPITLDPTLDVDIGASLLDVAENPDGAVEDTATSSFWYNAASPWIGLRFLNVTVPQGATASAGYVAVYLSGAADMQATIFCEDVDTAVAFQTGTSIFNVSNRTRTTASAAWTSATTGDVNTPSIVDPLNEVFARAGWASGNALAVILRGDSPCDTGWWMYDWHIHSLHVEYTTGGGTPSITPADGAQSQTGDLATVKSICILAPAENTQSQSGDVATVSAQNPPAGPTMIGPLYPGTATSGTVDIYVNDDWVSPTNIYADDNAFASITVNTFDAGDYSYMLSARVFGATVPTDGTISGIVSEIGKYRSAGTAVDAVVQLINGIGTTLGTNMAGTAIWPSSKATITYGGSTNLWGTTLTPAIVNGTSFGLQFAAQATGANTDVWVDFIRLYVYYYPSALGPNVTPAEGAQAQAGDAATANAISAISPAEGAQSQAGDAATAKGIIAVLPAEGAQSQAGDAPTVSASYTPNVTAVEGTQTQAGDPATLVATSSLTPGEGAQAQAGDAAILVGISAVTPAEGAQSQAQDAAVVSIATIITPAEGAQTQSGDVPTLGWVAVVTPGEGFQTQSGDIATFSLAGAITPGEGAQTQAQDAVTLGWIGLLTPGEGAQSQSGDEAVVWAISAIGPAEGNQTQTQDAATVTFGGIPTVNITPDEGAQGQTQDAAIAYHLTPIPPGEGFQTQSMDAAVAIGYAPTYSITAAEGAQTQTNDPAIIYAIYWITAVEGNQTQAMDLVMVTSSEEGYRIEAAPGARRTIITQDNVPEAELRRILKAR